MHLANYAKMSRDLVEVREICSRTRESGDALARETRLAFITDDYASLLARDDIDVIDICVPPAYLCGVSFCRDGQPSDHGLRLLEGLADAVNRSTAPQPPNRANA